MKTPSTARTIISVVILAMALGCCTVIGPGCSSGGPPPVPVDARRIHVGSGAIRVRARHDGVIWVVDETDHRTVWSGPVHRGDVIVLSTAPDSPGVLTVAGEVKVDKGLSAGHQYVVYENA